MSSVAAPESGGTSEKLPLGRTISQAYSAYFDHFLDVLRMAWLCIVVTAPLAVIVGWLQWSATAKLMTAFLADPRAKGLVQPFPIGLLVLNYSIEIIWILAGVSIAVAWHRRLILNERPGLSGSNVVTGDFWRYIGIGIIIVIIAMFPLPLLFLLIFKVALAPSGAPAGAPAGPPLFPGWELIFFLIAFVWAFMAMLRFSLLLPARAVGDRALTLKETWHRTRRNTWRLFWGIVVCMFVPELVLGILFQIATLTSIGFPTPARLADGTFILTFTVVGAIAIVFYILLAPLWIGFLSLSYLHFFGQPRQRAAAE